MNTADHFHLSETGTAARRGPSASQTKRNKRKTVSNTPFFCLLTKPRLTSYREKCGGRGNVHSALVRCANTLIERYQRNGESLVRFDSARAFVVERARLGRISALQKARRIM